MWKMRHNLKLSNIVGQKTIIASFFNGKTSLFKFSMTTWEGEFKRIRSSLILDVELTIKD